MGILVMQLATFNTISDVRRGVVWGVKQSPLLWKKKKVKRKKREKGKGEERKREKKRKKRRKGEDRYTSPNIENKYILKLFNKKILEKRESN